MIWDHDLDGTPKPRLISERAYRWIYSCVFALLTVAGWVLLIGVLRWLCIRSTFAPALIGYGPLLLALILAAPLARALIRRRGWRPPERMAARWISTPLAPAGEPAAGAVEAGLPAATIILGVVLSGTMAVVFGAFLILFHLVGEARNDFNAADWVFGSFSMVGILGAAWFVIVGVWIKPTVRVDGDGVLGYPRDLAIRRRFVPWSSVAAATLETAHNLNGCPRCTRPALFDHAGRRLIRLDMTGITRADQDRIVRAIQARLPR